ncbi:MAG: molybdopterin-binding oxidoreductase, partial [Geodermatophilaceae bacterium]|nr:molybdopterin-binding oxidoreductase [Geodermatophilaceae bacterium]
MIDTQAAPAERVTSPWGRRFRGALSGLLAASVSLGVAELLAGLVGPNSSPVLVVGGAFIDATPRP